MIDNGFCTDDFVLVKYISSGAFGHVFMVFDRSLNTYTAIKISKSSNNIELQREIDIIKELTLLDIPNTTKFYGSGYCSLFDNKSFKYKFGIQDTHPLYYEMSLQDEKLQTYIDNNNKLTSSQLFDIIFELLYTISYFRRYMFKHRDISTYNILYKINSQPREYTLLSNKIVTIHNDIQPIISDYNTSIFEPYNINNVNDFNDIIAILGVIQQLLDITPDIDDNSINIIQNMINDISDNDDLSYKFLQSILNKYY